MKRSEINAIVRDAEAFLRLSGFFLPPFAAWTPQDWQAKREMAREILECRLGWDVTDFGRGDFRNVGLAVFTLRNGRPENLEKYRGKTYGEKILIVDPGQVTPLHFHRVKMEDIINRGGGKLIVQLYDSTADEKLDTTDVVIMTDGLTRTLPAGGKLSLSPGESITIPQYCYHAFWAEDSRALIGEVSLVNDDTTDNRFYEEVARFAQVEEDEAPYRVLVSDYTLAPKISNP
jgi:D-lyxose ketol-isomerase